MMERLRKNPLQVTMFALLLAAGAVVAIAAAYGFGAFAHAWSHISPGWIVLVVGGELLSVAAYAVAYRKAVAAHDGLNLRLPLVVRVVTAGFGAFAVGGGFGLDKRALYAIRGEERKATVRVLGLGALEWALLAPAAWISAVVLLAVGDNRPLPSLLWPWALAVPIGFVIGFWLAAPARRDRINRPHGWRNRVGTALSGVGIVRWLARNITGCWLAWVGIALYWAFEIAAFYGALRFIGVRLNLGETIVGYATGYALTRRSTPLGGAGVTEVLMTFALHWLGQPVIPALAAVVVYRVFNFLLPSIPALLTRQQIEPLLRAADEDRVPARRARARAGAPLGDSA